MKTKIIQISAGKGPLECAFVVAKVLKIFLKELINNKIEYTILHKENGIENGTVQSVSIQIKGNNLADFTANWLGTIQWIGNSTFRKYHKRKNWFIGCFEVESSELITIKENEIKFQAIRSSGAGGQHVNKVSSAIRAKHLQTGIQVLVMDSRSQHQNKKIAIKRLQEKLEEFTVDQAGFGRPKNPDFLLKHGELAELFSDWQIIHSFEGVIDAKNTNVHNDSGKQAIAQIIARKPLC